MDDRPLAFPIRLVAAAYKEAGRNYLVNPHVNRSFQWYGVLHGRVDLVLGEATIRLRPEESVLIPPLASRSPRCGGRPPAYLWAVFDNVRLDLDDVAGRKLTTPEPLRPDLQALAAELRKPRGANTDELTQALLVRLLVGLARHAREEARSAPAALSPVGALSRRETVLRAQAFMRRNLHREIGREEVAAAVHLSAPHLARVFRAATGQTLNRSLTEMRLTQAKERLVGSSLSITQIAREVGFSSLSHFSQLFLREVGNTPSDYRRRGGRAWGP
ncbi:MAG: hypothetical protein AMXMBFR7_31330 [Planctomycetota bacterium]